MTATRAEFEVFAPGRVNLIGEHTDYNDGLVMPLAIDRGLRIAVRSRPGPLTVVSSTMGGPAVEIDLARPLAAGRGDWGRYVEGVLAGFQRLGWTIPAFEAAITADLPAGGGLSSSAALEVGIATVVEELCGRRLDPVAKALLCQRAEHEFAGVPCGIMDQFAVTLARRGHALRIDCRSHAVEHVPLARDVALLVIDSGVKHALADGGYAARRRECQSAAGMLGVPTLRDVSDANAEAALRGLPDVERRRARHVLGENARVLGFAAAATRGDWQAAGRLMHESHASLRDDFEVSCRELDLICAAVGGVAGVYGCRMTGGGFGGCAVALLERRAADEVVAAARAACSATLGHEPTMFPTTPGPAAHRT